MLCPACVEVFSGPRKLAYGSVRPWKQTAESFRAALSTGCQLCHLIDEARRYNSRQHADFPVNTHYAFKPLKSDWARHGKGSKWFTYQEPPGRGDCQGDPDGYLDAVEQDPTPNQLGGLLATDADNLLQEASNSWIVLQFYGREDIILPIEIRTRNALQHLAEKNLDQQTSTGQPETLELARAWLQNCLENHPSCGPRHPEEWLPTRLLDVGTPEAPLLRLVSGASLDAASPYVALSHRWGVDQEAFTLKSEYVAPYQTAIPPSHVSDTVRDAAHATRALGIRYLWVDCMCIVQDDGGGDFARESATMYKVYGLATCTIAAANSGGNGHSGLFAARNPYRVRPLSVSNPFSMGCTHTFNIMSQYLCRIHEDGVRGSEWFGRGWVFQERIMSPRLLVFSRAQVLWGCSRLQAAETWPCGKTGENHIDRFASVETDKTRLHALADARDGIAVSHAAWWAFLADYMAAELTLQTDRLAAIRGIATMVEGLTGERYRAGFWLTGDLPNALLWTTKEAFYRVPRPAEYLAPSFSWAAVEHRQHIRFSEASPGATNLVRDIEGVTLHEDIHGRNIREALRMSGRLIPASILTASVDEGSHGVMTRETGLKWREIIEQEIAYSRSLPARTHVLINKFKATLRDLSYRIVSLASRALETWLMWVLIVLGAPIFVALALAVLGIAVALFIAAAGAALALLPVGCTLYALCVLLVVLNTVAYRFWTTRLYPRLFASRIRRAEQQLAQEKAEHEADVVRRQREAEARAERVFADLEKGVRFDDPSSVVAVGKDENKVEEDVLFSFYSDFRLPHREVIDVYCLPLVQFAGKEGSVGDGGRVGGLVVRAVNATSDHYERLGVFRVSHEGIVQLPEGGEEELLLV